MQNETVPRSWLVAEESSSRTRCQSSSLRDAKRPSRITARSARPVIPYAPAARVGDPPSLCFGVNDRLLRP